MPRLTDAQLNSLRSDYQAIQSKLVARGITAPGNTELNEFTDTLINLYYMESTYNAFVDKKEFWTKWSGNMPANIAQALTTIIAPSESYEFDLSKFVPDKQMILDNFEQNYVTQYKRQSGISLNYNILKGAFNNIGAYKGFIESYVAKLDESIYRFKYFNYLYQLLFSDKKLSASAKDIVVVATTSAGIPTYKNPTVKKAFKFLDAQHDPKDPKGAVLTNKSFYTLLQHVNNLSIPNQSNYNLGDPADNTKYLYGIPWTENANDMVLFMPQSVRTKYLASTDSAIGIAQVFNKELVDLANKFGSIEVYDDVSPKITIRKYGADGVAKMTPIDNPFYTDPTPTPATQSKSKYTPTYRFGIFNKKAMLIRTRFEEVATQMWTRNQTMTWFATYWINAGINPYAQGFIYDIEMKTSDPA